MTRSPTPANGQTWQSRNQPGRTITLTHVGSSWTRFTEDQEQAHTGAPKPGLVPTRELSHGFRLINPTP